MDEMTPRIPQLLRGLGLRVPALAKRRPVMGEPRELDAGPRRLLTPSPVLGRCIRLAFPAPRGCPDEPVMGP